MKEEQVCQRGPPPKKNGRERRKNSSSKARRPGSLPSLSLTSLPEIRRDFTTID